MRHFVWLFKVYAVLYIISSNAEGASKQNVVVSFLEKFIKPFLRATRLGPLEITSAAGKTPETAMIRQIRKKVFDLQNVLEDNSTIETDNNLTLRGNEDTAVIEFLPETYRRSHNITTGEVNDTFKSSINKYKLLREQVKKALEDELVSQDTKNLIMNTLDDMIRHMIESQCTWNSHPLRRQLNRNSTSQSLSRVQSMTKKQWKKLRQQYIEYLTNRKTQENLFMQQFHQFFSQVINETSNLTERYKIKCQLVELQGHDYNPKPVLRVGLGEKKCPNFKLCSGELTDFLIDFYLSLNDTIVSTFKNYAAMYVRDFAVDSNKVISTINKFGIYASDKIDKIFKNELKYYEPAEDKDKTENVRLIVNFMKTVITEVKSDIRKHLVSTLGKKKTKLYLTIKEDLFVNIEVDLDNLENYYIDNLCTKFLMCNGKYASRRSEDKWMFRPKHNNEIYVQVQLKLDDKFKGAVANSGIFNLMAEDKKVHYNIKQNLNFRDSKLNITRTMATNDGTYKPTKQGKMGKHTGSPLKGTFAIRSKVENETVMT